MARAAGVVAMGGYNTFCEILSFDKRALIVPRTAPRLEQFIRAKRAAELGLVAMLSERARPRPASHGGGAAPAAAAAAALGGRHPRPARRHAKVNRLARKWLDQGRGRVLRGAGALRNLSVAALQRAAGRVAFVLKGLSAAVRDLHRAGDPGAGAARARHPDRVVAPSDRPRDPSGPPRRSGRRCSTCRNTCITSRRRVWRGWRRSRRLPGYRAARRAWLADLRRDPTPNRIRRFGQALVLAAELPADIGRLHAHFLHTPASVARYAAMMRGLAWTVSAHAKDIWTIPEWEKRDKARRKRDWAVTCTESGARHLAGPGAAARRGMARAITGSISSAFAPPPRGRAGATAATRHSRSSCCRSVARSRRRAMTICSPRWRCCRRTSPGASCISAAARSLRR